jgi:hypothetical protein
MTLGSIQFLILSPDVKVAEDYMSQLGVVKDLPLISINFSAEKKELKRGTANVFMTLCLCSRILFHSRSWLV